MCPVKRVVKCTEHMKTANVEGHFMYNLLSVEIFLSFKHYIVNNEY